jgi:hypothetical protein
MLRKASREHLLCVSIDANARDAGSEILQALGNDLGHAGKNPEGIGGAVRGLQVLLVVRLPRSKEEEGGQN